MIYEFFSYNAQTVQVISDEEQGERILEFMREKQLVKSETKSDKKWAHDQENIITNPDKIAIIINTRVGGQRLKDIVRNI